MVATDPDQGSDKDFVEYVVKQLVQYPDKVVVSREIDEMGVLITLQVSKDDMGKIIGKNGQTAKAIRILLRVIGSKNNARVNLKIVEPEGMEGEGGAVEEAPTEEAPREEEAKEEASTDEPDISGDIKL